MKTHIAIIILQKPKMNNSCPDSFHKEKENHYQININTPLHCSPLASDRYPVSKINICPLIIASQPRGVIAPLQDMSVLLISP